MQFVRRMAGRAAVCDPSLTTYDFEEATSETCDELFDLECEAIAKHGDLDLPPSTVLKITTTRWSRSIVCAGFRLSTL